MQLFYFKSCKIYFLFFLMGLFVLGPLSIPSFAAESRVGFVDIQKAVINTKEWKQEFEVFKKNFAKAKKKIKARESRIKKMRKRADDLLRDMRNRIENYNSWGDEEKTQNENESDAVYNKEKNETVDVS